MPTTRRTVHGLVVESPVALAAGSAAGGEPPDVRLELSTGRLPPAEGVVLADCRAPGPGYLLTRDDERWALTFPDVAAVRWRADGADVEVRAAPSVPVELLTVLLAGPVLTAVAVSRGHTVLHASAVSWDGAGAVALAGPRGGGKSSVARLLVGDGRTLLSDDALRVDVRSDGVLAHRGTTASRLRTDLVVGDGEATRASADGRILVGGEDGAPASARLRAVVRPLLSRTATTPRLRELSSLEALTLLATSWPLDGVTDPDLLAGRLGGAAPLVARVPVLALEVPWADPASPAARGSLVAVVGELLSRGGSAGRTPGRTPGRVGVR